MQNAIGKGTFVLGVGLAAGLVVSVEMFAYALWLFDRTPSCQSNTDETCAFNAIAALIVGGLGGLVALVGALAAAAFLVAGRRGDATTVLLGLGALLAIGHVWLLL